MKIKTLTIILVCLVLSICSFFTVNFFLNKKKDLIFDNYIFKFDSLIHSASTYEIDSFILTGESLLHDSLSYKRFLKRLYLLKKWDNILLISEKAYNKYPSDNKIFAIYLFSLIILDKYDKAFEIIKNGNKNIIPEYLLLLTNIFLNKTNIEDNVFYHILEKESTYLYNKLYEVSNDHRFLINKALMELKSGKFDEAEKTLSNINESNIRFNKLYLLSKYSNKRYDEVQNLLLTYDYNLSKENLALLNIDICIKQKSYIKAQDLLEKFIYFYPEYSADPYINLINLKLFIDIKNPDTYIESALKNFPNNLKLLFTVVDYYKNNNNEAIAIEIIKQYQNNSNTNKEVEIFLKQLKGTDNPEIFTNNLYELLNLDPSNPIISKYLAWNLYENNEISKLKVFLTNFDKDSGWSLFFKALISVYEGDNTIAVDLLQKSFNIERNWETIYNQAVIYEHADKFQKAIEQYQNAENIIPNISDNNHIKSMIRTSLANLYYDIKDYSNAYREVKNAIDQNGNNLKAYLLLKKLESSTF